jgi:cell division septation protein DedD
MTGAKGALVLIIASVGSVALFFAVAQVVDFITFKNSSAQPRRLLPFESPPLPAVGNFKNNKAAPKPEPPLKLGFYTSLSKPDQNTAPAAIPQKKADTKTAQVKTPAESVFPAKNLQETKHVPSPVESTPPAKIAQEAKKTMQEQPAGGAQYILQAGAFQRADKAAQVVAELKNAGYTAYTDTITVPGKGTLIRVRIGAFHDVSEARRKAAEVQVKTKIPVLISKK